MRRLGERDTEARYFVTISTEAVAEVLPCEKTASSVKLEPLYAPAVELVFYRPVLKC